MIIKKMKLDELRKSDYNPRTMSKSELKKLENSIKAFGYIEPIIWNKKTERIVGGHQRLDALKNLGEKDADVVVVDLDETNEKILNLALNKISGKWDEEKLSKILKSMDDVSDLTGFDNFDVDKAIIDKPFPEKDLGERIETTNRCPKCSYEW